MGVPPAVRRGVSFAPSGALSSSVLSPGLRRGLCSFAAPWRLSFASRFPRSSESSSWPTVTNDQRPLRPGRRLTTDDRRLCNSTPTSSRQWELSSARGVARLSRSWPDGKAHRLVVEQGRGESRQVMALEIRAGVGDQREAGRVRLGKSIKRERSDACTICVLNRAGKAVTRACRLADDFHMSLLLFDRLKPKARRNSSASPPVNPAAIMAMRSNCS